MCPAQPLLPASPSPPYLDCAPLVHGTQDQVRILRPFQRLHQPPHSFEQTATCSALHTQTDASSRPMFRVLMGVLNACGRTDSTHRIMHMQVCETYAMRGWRVLKGMHAWKREGHPDVTDVTDVTHAVSCGCTWNSPRSRRRSARSSGSVEQVRKHRHNTFDVIKPSNTECLQGAKAGTRLSSAVPGVYTASMRP